MSMLKVLSASTRPVKVLLLTVRVTVSPTWASPPTVPVTATVPIASAMLMVSSAVMSASRVMVGCSGSTTLTIFCPGR